MPRKRSRHIVFSYVVTLLVTIALLVVWVIYVLRSISTINELASRLGGTGETYHWVVLGIGCALFSLVIVGLTLQLAHAFAERSYSQKQEEFVSNITHEMKSPLAAIKLHGQTLKNGGLSTEETSRSVDLVLQQVERMGALIDNVLESSRLVARRDHKVGEPIPLYQFFSEYFRDMSESIEAGNVKFSFELETQAEVWATAEKLRRVMTNLIDNAIRFSSRGGEVRCLVRDLGERVRIEVEDNGVGIPKKELGKVFDRFYQVGAVDERRRGTGLGLSIVAGLVEEMKGRVFALSADSGRGTRFVIELPILTPAGSQS